MEAFRKKLPLLAEQDAKKSLFLNYAATCPLSQGSIEKIQAAAGQMAQPLGKYFYEALNVVEQTRRELAELIGAHPRELAFSQNTSTALSQIALAAPLRPGDRVLAPDNEFSSNFYVWQNLQQKGVKFSPFHIVPGTPVVETLKLLDLRDVRLITLSAVSYETGRLHELEEFTRFCRERGILSCLDAIQAVGAVPIDAHRLGVDFLAGGAQKWLLGPVGCGYLYAREELLEQLFVPFVGWTSAQYPEYFDLKSWSFASEMTRFEPGLPNFLSIVGLGQSLRELKEFGWAEIYNGIQANTAHLRAGIAELGCETLTHASDQTAGILSFRAPAGMDHRDVHAHFDRHSVTVTTRQDYIRVSPHFFNTPQELERFFEVTAKLYHKTKISVPRAEDRPAQTTASAAAPGRILITGAAGNLGAAMARELGERGYPLHLVDINASALGALEQELHQRFPTVDFRVETLDLSDSEEVRNFCSRLGERDPRGYAGLIQCAGAEETDVFHRMKPERIAELFQVNLLAPARLMHAFITTLAKPGCIGILNLVSSTGRCGYPLLSVYGAASGGLWTLGEALAREQKRETEVPVTTFVAPSMHSPMQKRMGRIALRYFKMAGGFDYALTETVAREAIEAWLRGDPLHVARANRMKLWINSLVPSLVDGRVDRVWKRT